MFEPRLTPSEYLERNRVAIEMMRSGLRALEKKSLTAKGKERSLIARKAKVAAKRISNIYHNERLQIALMDDPSKYSQGFTILGQELANIVKLYNLLGKLNEITAL